ncbi:MAG TPA: hypothetical protein P5080_04875 [Candidatus Paceibacterota bacterium]|nr:hypothetical protein [Candidatus Pacearchaeota archaeon]HSA37007.1 hypothetical protein [Candidatus Paceibacterota bacterium]
MGSEEKELSPVMAGDRLVDIFQQAMDLLAKKASDEKRVDWAAILVANGLDISILARSCLQEDFKEAGEHLRQLLIVKDIGQLLADSLAVGALRYGIEMSDREGSLAEHRLNVFSAITGIYEAAIIAAKSFPELANRIDQAQFQYFSWNYEAVRQKWGSL